MLRLALDLSSIPSRFHYLCESPARAAASGAHDYCQRHVERLELLRKNWIDPLRRAN